MLAELPPRQRAVLAFRFLDDRTEAQTAALLSMPVGTVKSTTSRALARLNELLAPDEDRAEVGATADTLPSPDDEEA